MYFTKLCAFRLITVFVSDSFSNQVGFGKSMPTCCAWIEGIADTVSEKYLGTQLFASYGTVMAVYIDRKTSRGLVLYETVDQAVTAVNDMKGRCIVDRKIQVYFKIYFLALFFVSNHTSIPRETQNLPASIFRPSPIS